MHRQLYSQLADICSEKSRYYDKRLVLWRNDEEESFLRSWIADPRSEKPAVGRLTSVEDTNDITNLKNFISNCVKCGSVVEKKPGVGTGASGIMVILHAPRLIGKIEMQLFKKDSVAMLKQIVSSLKVPFGDCYITNMIKCESEDCFTKPSEMASNCLSILERELYIVKPRIVLVMGEMQPLSKMINNSRGILWFTIEHPITMLKNPDLKRSAWDTLKNIIAKMQEPGFA